tara:strand:+ start:504 stop:686 length:183 start_codon:yes stop_codon:yes gene_type:complete
MSNDDETVPHLIVAVILVIIIVSIIKWLPIGLTLLFVAIGAYFFSVYGDEIEERMATELA